MTGLGIFIKKEFRELVRTKKLMIIMLVFIVFGIMNPAIAKITPLLFKAMESELVGQGIIIDNISVTAMDSWLQFEKNIPMALIVFILMFGGIFTKEYSKGTLIPFLTKGLSREAVVISKLFIMLFTWSIGILICFYVTYFYTDFYWDNSTVEYVFFAAAGWWLAGVFFIAAIVFFSSFATSGSQVLMGVAGIYFVMILMGIHEKLGKCLPTYLMNSSMLYKGVLKPENMTKAAIVTVIVSVSLIILSLIKTKTRQL